MTKFLDTRDIINFLERIIKNAKERVILISPYIDIHERYKYLIVAKNEEHIPVTIVWGKKKNQRKFNSEIKNWIGSMKFVEQIFYKYVHAKCYLNENEAIITSMNFYSASEKNIEMGILLTKQSDREAYEDLWKKVNRILENRSKFISIHKDSTIERSGFCIRCRTPIKIDLTHPYCKNNLGALNKFGREPCCVEKAGFCHLCGKPNPSSMEKPVCGDCHNRIKNFY